jgi:uncharacterized protein (DUF2235 family)
MTQGNRPERNRTNGGKNIVICLDGTNNRVRDEANTNVVRLYHLLALDHPSKQVAYYGPGVGTFSATGAWSPPAQAISRGLGLAFGAGIRPALGNAYTFLMSVYEPGDRIFVFGFSRGAYMARALCGLLEVFGVFRPGAEPLVPYAIREYTAMTHFTNSYDKHRVPAYVKEQEQRHWKALDAFEDFAQRRRVPDERDPKGFSLQYKHVPVHFVGLWDTVNAVGTRLRTIGWPYTSTLPHARTVRSAVALDEWRWRYRPVFVNRSEGHPFQSHSDIQQVWFAGVHSDVGGRYRQGARLSDIPLAWMVKEAINYGLLVSPAKLRFALGLDETRQPSPDGDKLISLTTAEASGAPHQHPPVWRLMGWKRRQPLPGAMVHGSVKERLDDPRYAKQLKGCKFVDLEWTDTSWVPDVPSH